jgi:heme exporter protein B
LSDSASRPEALDTETRQQPETVRVQGRAESDWSIWSGQAAAVFRKDVRVELRNRTALNAILLFAVTALVVVGFAVGPGQVNPVLKAALLWVVLFFAAFSGLSHVFLHEEETGTSMALRLTAAPSAVFAGKLAINMLLLLVITLVVTPAFAMMVHLEVSRPLAFMAVLLSGGVGLAAAATIVAAIIAAAKGKGALYGALGFPLLLPLLLMAVHGTHLTMTDAPFADIFRIVTGMVSFGVMLITASFLLFPYVWED